MRLLRHRALHFSVALGVGAVFLYASASKIAHPRDFARIIYHYQLIGPSRTLGYLPANLLAVILPWVEVVTGLLLVLNLWRREAAATAALMLLAFLTAVSWALLHGIDIENCGCFSVTGAGRAAGLKLVVEDAILLAGSILLVTVPPPTAAASDAVAEGEARTDRPR